VRLFGSRGPCQPSLDACPSPTSRAHPCRTLDITLQSFWIEVPCDNSCDNSWPIGGNHGESRSVTRADAGPSEAQTRRPQIYDLLLVVAMGGVEPPTFRFSVGDGDLLAAEAGIKGGVN